MFKNTVKTDIWFQTSYIYLLIQQVIVASSSIWLTKFILGISEQQPSLAWLWVYLLSLILPYLPGALVLVEVSKSKIKTCIDYIQKFSELYPGQIARWSDPQQHSRLSSILTAEACPTINDFIDYLYHLAASGLNVFFNLLILSVLIDASLFITCVIGILLSSCILYFQKKIKVKLALKAQENRIQWTSSLGKAWDNVLLNNLFNLTIWNKKRRNLGEQLSDSTVELEKFNQLIGISMAFTLILPSMIFVAYLAIINFNNLPFLATLAVLFPRLFQVMTFAYELLFYVSDFPVQQAKLNTVLSVIQSNAHKENNDTLLSRIHWERISFNQPFKGLTPNDLLTSVPEKGRLTLYGENGSGKTSLLLMIKATHQEKAFYLPSKHGLLFEIENTHLSTGQLVFQILKKIRDSVETPIILLDEWDANLDKKNRDELSSLIDDLSLERCVIEVRHIKHEETSGLLKPALALER